MRNSSHLGFSCFLTTGWDVGNQAMWFLGNIPCTCSNSSICKFQQHLVKFNKCLAVAGVRDGNHLACSIFIVGCGTGKVLGMSFQTHENNEPTLLRFFLLNPQPIFCWATDEKRGASGTSALILPSRISVKNYPDPVAC